jgi:hypothetical protein
VANSTDWFSLPGKGADQVDDIAVDAQVIGITDTARQD